MPADRAPDSKEAWLESVMDAERRGELLLTFDLVERALVELPGDVDLQYRAVLALARSGSTAEAARRFDEYGLGAVEDEDVEALSARIKKDAALAAESDDWKRLAREAAAEYRAIYERTGGYYPAVNAATLLFLAGDRDAATDLARATLRAVADAGDDSYYGLATDAEAHLLLHEVEEAVTALEGAARANAGDYGALATTRRQLRVICQSAGIDTDILTAVAGPAVVHFCGHRIADGDNAPFRSVDEEAVAREIKQVVGSLNVGFAYGSLASGADILWAEAVLALGAELHVVLPFALEEFVECSVAPSGGTWVERFNQCFDRASSVTYATVDAYSGDDVLYRCCSEIAMGLTLVRARFLDAEVHQFAVWDGEPARGEAGTAIDVAIWGRAGNPTTVVRPPVAGDAPVATRMVAVDGDIPERDGRPGDHRPGRVVRAMLFADVRGFSKLTDEQLPTFAEYVFAAFAEVLERHGDAVEYSNTWGDALYAVISDATSAAACALDLQDAIAGLDPASVGLPADLSLRLGGHVGPIFPVTDPIIGRRSFVGSHVNRTARIEPVTPPGAVYVTSPFAAALELAGNHPFACDYVGHRPAAKDYGSLRMYRLRRASATPLNSPRDPGGASSRGTRA